MGRQPIGAPLPSQPRFRAERRIGEVFFGETSTHAALLENHH